MLRSQNTLRRALAAITSILLAATVAWAIPVHFVLSGTLKDASGNPLLFAVDHGPDHGGIEKDAWVTLAAKVTFFASESSSEIIEEQMISATAQTGVFYAPVIVSDRLLAQDELWYAIAIDTDRNGLDAQDRFEGRFQISSVPFALSAKPVTYFSSHGGSLSTWSGVRYGYSTFANAMVVAPFVTPPGGVRFNRMNIFVDTVEASTTLSFGIYDQNGGLVASSGKVFSSYSFTNAYLEVKDVERRLAPSTLYFTAILANPNKQLSLRNIIIPNIPIVGYVRDVAAGGLIPPTFNVKTIDPDPAHLPIPVSVELSYDEPTSTSQSLAALNKTGPSKPIVRWITSKGAKR